ncbi:MAG: hypothetical protein ACO24D_15920 [bacterium]
MSTRILAALLFSPLLFSCGGDDPLMPPAVPGNLVAEAGPNSKQITLNWNAVSNATSYTIFWNTVPTQAKFKDAEQKDQRIDEVSNPFTHENLGAGQYYYRVAASNQAGSRGLSSEASASLTP